MTQEEIIEIAIQAGWDEHHAKFDTRFEPFARLVAEKERESCAKVCDGYSDGRHANMADLCAEAIRARGEQE